MEQRMRFGTLGGLLGLVLVMALMLMLGMSSVAYAVDADSGNAAGLRNISVGDQNAAPGNIATEEDSWAPFAASAGLKVDPEGSGEIRFYRMAYGDCYFAVPTDGYAFDHWDYNKTSGVFVYEYPCELIAVSDLPGTVTAYFVKKMEANPGGTDGNTNAQEAAAKVSSLIAALPAEPSKEDEKQVQQVMGAFGAYVALSDEAKALVADSDAAMLQEALDYPARVETASLASVKAKKGRKAVVKWKENPEADGYQLCYKAKGGKAKTVSIDDVKTVKATVKKLKAGKTYTFRIRPYTTVEDLFAGSSGGGLKKVYGKWSAVRKIKAKK